MQHVGLFGKQCPEAPKGLRCEAWKGRKPMPWVTGHRWFLWTTAAQSYWGPLGDDEDCFRTDPPEQSEKDKVFTRHLSFAVGWGLLLGTLIPRYFQHAAFVVGRAPRCFQQNEERQWTWAGWGGHQHHLLHLHFTLMSKEKVDLSHGLWWNST